MFGSFYNAFSRTARKGDSRRDRGGALLPADPVVAATSERFCANCGASAPGKYCPACGQNTRERLPTFVQFMREATGRYLSFEGKLWRTLFPLLVRPGFLTREYFIGRRQRYILPARLFLISSLLFFAALRLATESMDLDKALITDGADAKAEMKKRSAFPSRLPGEEDGLNIDFGDLPESAAPLKKRVDRFNQLPRAQKVEHVVGNTLRYGPYAMFVLLPAFAGLLKVVYLGRRRKRPLRPRLYGEHLVFAAHNHAFLFIAVTMLFAVPVEIIRQAIGCWIFAYLVWSMHVIYRGSWIGLAMRAFVLLILYAVLFGLVTAGLLIAAILLR